MSADVTARLEAVAARLERVAARMGGGGGGGDDDDDVPMYVADYEAIVNTQVKALVDATNKLGIPEMSALLQSAYDNNLALVKRVPTTKKPSPQDLQAFLAPAIAAMQSADNIRYKGKNYKKFGDHYKAMYECIMVVSWVTMAPPNGLPAQHVEGQAGSCDFNLNRVRKNHKDEDSKNWMTACRALNKKVAEFVKANFKKTGLTWNPKGKALGDAAPATTTSSYAKDDEKKAPAKKAAAKKGGGGAAGGMDSVFSALNKGTGITKGMKKVTSDMKTKNRKVKTSGKVEMKAKKAKGRKKFGPPQTKFVGGRWMVENYDEGQVLVDKCQIRQNVFITMCDRATIQIPTKVKAVTIDNCVKCQVFVSEVVSCVELVNCKSVRVTIQKSAPSITVDKCESPLIILSKSAFAAAPGIYTSNVTAMNIEIPGATESDDPVEIPVPEQFLTKIDPKSRKATTTHTEH